MHLDRLLELSPDALSTNISFQEADFFTFSVQKDELFDLVYDYTSASGNIIILTVSTDTSYPGSLSPSHLPNVFIGDSK